MEVSGLPRDFQLALADRYLLEREIGAGGMATVWLANEIRYQRPVAIKVLRAELSATLGHERFLNEIRIAASLEHPNVLTLLDSGTAGGLLFFVTPFVDGETLRQLVELEGPLSLETGLSVASDVSAALHYAHSRGIIHRDVKPSNILLHKGRAVVTDFGIALGLGTSDSHRLTQAGMALGTAQYMSPEQARGEEVDARSDIYSLACTLFEAFSGQLPFSGNRRHVLLAQHASSPVPELRRVRPGVPRHLSDALKRAMEKRPEDRPETVTEFLGALQGRATSSRRPPLYRLRRLLGASGLRGAAAQKEGKRREPRVVVLPFLDLSKARDCAYIGEGIAEEIISAIWKTHGIEVVSRTSAFQFQTSGKSLKEFARELRATHAVEGSVQAWPGEYRVTVRLVEGATGDGLSETTFNISRDEKKLLQVQYQIANWVVGELGDRTGPVNEDQGHRSVFRAELALYRGRDAWARRSGIGFQEAREAFAECLKADPRHPKGHAAMADLYNLLGAFDYCHLAPREAFPTAIRYARKSLDLDPSLAEGHAALGNALLSYEWDGVAAAESLERAIEMNPGYSPARQWYSMLLMMEGREGEAEVEAYRALEYDPKSPFIWANIGRILQFRRQFDQAAEKFEAALKQGRSYPPAYVALAVNAIKSGEPERGLELLERVTRAATGSPGPIVESLKGHVLGVLGRTSEARAVAEELARRYRAYPGNRTTGKSPPPTPVVESVQVTTYAPAEFVALVHMGLNEPDEAIAWLELAKENRSQVIAFLGIEPMFDALRPDPRFDALVRSLRLRGGGD